MRLFRSLFSCIFRDPESPIQPSNTTTAIGNKVEGPGDYTKITTNATNIDRTIPDHTAEDSDEGGGAVKDISNIVLAIADPVIEVSGVFPPLKIVAVGLKLIFEHAEVRVTLSRGQLLRVYMLFLVAVDGSG